MLLNLCSRGYPHHPWARWEPGLLWNLTPLVPLPVFPAFGTLPPHHNQYPFPTESYVLVSCCRRRSSSLIVIGSCLPPHRHAVCMKGRLYWSGEGKAEWALIPCCIDDWWPTWQSLFTRSPQQARHRHQWSSVRPRVVDCIVVRFRTQNWARYVPGVFTKLLSCCWMWLTGVFAVMPLFLQQVPNIILRSFDCSVLLHYEENDEN